jgi:hypothetical protein
VPSFARCIASHPFTTLLHTLTQPRLSCERSSRSTPRFAPLLSSKRRQLSTVAPAPRPIHHRRGFIVIQSTSSQSQHRPAGSTCRVASSPTILTFPAGARLSLSHTRLPLFHQFLFRDLSALLVYQVSIVYGSIFELPAIASPTCRKPSLHLRLPSHKMPHCHQIRQRART